MYTETSHEGDSMLNEAARDSDPEGAAKQDLESVVAEVSALRHQVAALESRVARLEVREELWEEPDAAGDEPISR